MFACFFFTPRSTLNRVLLFTRIRASFFIQILSLVLEPCSLTFALISRTCVILRSLLEPRLTGDLFLFYILNFILRFCFIFMLWISPNLLKIRNIHISNNFFKMFKRNILFISLFYVLLSNSVCVCARESYCICISCRSLL